MTETKEIKPSRGVYVKSNLIQRLIQFYLLPELQKKEFKKLQLIFKPEVITPEILYDEEAKEVLVETRLKEDILKKKEGEYVYLHEITGEVRKAIIIGEEDSLHATFLNSAETDFSKCQWHPFIDNLFSAYELLMGIYLVSLPYIEAPKEIRPLVKGKISHKRITSEGSKLRYSGIISKNRFKVLTQLKKLRWSARYTHEDLSLTEDEAKRFLNEASDFLRFMKKTTES